MTIATDKYFDKGQKVQYVIFVIAKVPLDGRAYLKYIFVYKCFYRTASLRTTF